jgi:kynurenine formamidase
MILRKPSGISPMLAGILLLLSGVDGQAGNGILGRYALHDLSHNVPLFGPVEGSTSRSDINKPIAGSRPVAGSGGALGVRIAKPLMSVGHGKVQWGYIYMEEHYSTHVDSTDHYLTTDESLITVAEPDARSIHEYTLEELTGPIVYIDISKRVQAELKKNKGRPSTDTKVTNFDDGSGANVTAADIDRVASQLVDGAYLVINAGWEQFYIGAPPADGDHWRHPYINNMNHPGVSRAAVNRLLAIEKARGIRIGGLVADNIAVESGHSIRGRMGTDKVDPTRLAMYMHAVGLPRGWKLVENAANLDLLAAYPPASCDLLIGAPKLMGVSGVPSRLMAICEKQ